MKFKKPHLLVKIIIAILLGAVLGLVFPDWLSRVFITFNSLFSNFLGFIIPLLILGLVAPGIAELGRGAGRLLLITVLLAYVFTLFSGFSTFAVCNSLFPLILTGMSNVNISENVNALTPYFTIDMPPLFGVMSALVLAFVLGISLAYIQGGALKGVIDDFKDVISFIISSVIIPLLPLYIFGLFVQISENGQIQNVLVVFIKLIVIIFIMAVLLLIIQFSIAGLVAKRNPFKMLGTMLTAYFTALGTQSSAATIPITLQQVIKLGVRPYIAGFTVPLCATIHMSGSMLKITACSIAVLMMMHADVSFYTYTMFIFTLAITMVAAPGVPGGCIMAAIGPLQSILMFDDTMCGLMIATYIAMDSFGTATNVTGDGAVSVIVDTIDSKLLKPKIAQ